MKITDSNFKLGFGLVCIMFGLLMFVATVVSLFSTFSRKEWESIFQIGSWSVTYLALGVISCCETSAARTTKIGRHELTEQRSARVRFLISLAWSLPWLGGIWLLERSVTMVAILAVVFLYLSAIGVALGDWRFSRPDASPEREQRLRGLLILPVLVGIPVAIYFFT